MQNDILKLVSCHYEGDEEGFRQAALELASSIKEEQPQIYHELMDLLESENASLTTFFKKYERKEKTLFLPECITDDLVQVVHTLLFTAARLHSSKKIKRHPKSSDFLKSRYLGCLIL